jgi:hypothetical protein
MAHPSPPKVVKLRRSGGVLIQDCDVYIGRGVYRGGWKLETSIWANPYIVGKHGDRATVVDKYEKHVLGSHKLMARLPELMGKTLGCWCHPLPCHGHVLRRLAIQQAQKAQAGTDGPAVVGASVAGTAANDLVPAPPAVLSKTSAPHRHRG